MTSAAEIKTNVVDQLQAVQDAIVGKWNQSDAAGHGDPSCLHCLHLLLQAQGEIVETLLRNFDAEAEDEPNGDEVHH